MAATDFDLFVIGAGSGGVRAARLAGAARRARRGGRDAALGGTCVNVGCIPKKLYSFASHYAESFEEARGFGWAAGRAGVRLGHAQAQPRRRDRPPQRRLRAAARRRRRDAAAQAAPDWSGRTRSRSTAGVHRAERIVVATGGWPVAARRRRRRAGDQLERDLRPAASSRAAWSSSAAATSPASSRRSSTASAPR